LKRIKVGVFHDEAEAHGLSRQLTDVGALLPLHREVNLISYYLLAVGQ
jgi:hypothetical protein